MASSSSNVCTVCKEGTLESDVVGCEAIKVLIRVHCARLLTFFEVCSSCGAFVENSGNLVSDRQSLFEAKWYNGFFVRHFLVFYFGFLQGFLAYEDIESHREYEIKAFSLFWKFSLGKLDQRNRFVGEKIKIADGNGNSGNLRFHFF